jgi:sucrase/ferredoxin-like protein
VVARAFDEPLAGTAPAGPRWACLEHRGPWPHDVGAHPDPAVAGFAARAATAGWRFLLVRRPGRRAAAGPVRLLLADTTTAEATTLVLDGPGELSAVSLPRAGAALPGRPVADAPIMVCTHGRRDRCCALDGRALAAALVEAGEPQVWESSHLGGHRFAPTALVLPTGYLYGRLDPATAISARKAADAGEVETARCRGRSSWSPAGQVAELAVRALTGLRDAAALRVADTAGGALVTHVHDGRRWAVDVAAHEGPAPCSSSCGVAALPRLALRATVVRPLDPAVPPPTAPGVR